MKSPSLYSILLLSVSVSRVGASPTGASGCPAGESAAGGPHANRSPGNLGALSGGNFTLSINGDEISDSMELSTGSEYTLSLSGAEFRGFLFRLESSGVNASSYLTPGTVGGSQPTAIGICPDDVGSVTHSMNDAKMEATAILNIGNPGMYSMDVTVSQEEKGKPIIIVRLLLHNVFMCLSCKGCHANVRAG